MLKYLVWDADILFEILSNWSISIRTKENATNNDLYRTTFGT